MNLDFLNDLVEFAKTASIVIKIAVKALTILASLFPAVAIVIRNGVTKWFEIFDTKKAEGVDESVIEQMKPVAEGDVIASVMEEFHGSRSPISKSIIKSMISLYVTILKAMRYGEDERRNEQAKLKGYMSTNEDVINAEKTHAGFKLFGV